MTKGAIFWLLMIVWFFFGAYTNRTLSDRWAVGGSLLLFAVIFLLGWEQFGFVIR